MVLQRYGIVSQSERPTIAGDMLRLGFELYEEQRKLAVPIGDIGPELVDDNQMNEWAEELAVIGKRRNILEKSLRELFLNFVRADFLRKRTTSTVGERISENLIAERRKKLGNRTADKMIDGLYWKELIDLICDKEWSLFGQLLGDKARFRQHCEIINDRPDAHAKKVDAADLALYRRSLQALEDLLLKVM